MKKRIEVLKAKHVEIGSEIDLHPLSGITVAMRNLQISIGSSGGAWVWLGNNEKRIQVDCCDGYAGVIINAKKPNFAGYLEDKFFSPEFVKD